MDSVTVFPYTFDVPPPYDETNIVIKIIDNEACVDGEVIPISPTPTSSVTPTMTPAQLEAFQSGLKGFSKGVGKFSPALGMIGRMLGWAIDIAGWQKAREQSGYGGETTAPALGGMSYHDSVGGTEGLGAGGGVGAGNTSGAGAQGVGGSAAGQASDQY